MVIDGHTISGTDNDIIHFGLIVAARKKEIIAAYMMIKSDSFGSRFFRHAGGLLFVTNKCPTNLFLLQIFFYARGNTVHTSFES